ncbi:M14-type cytosolic carboxypeptidase [Paracoccus sp. S-4012]|uniref:M14 family metallopeptidase n=1 Tax=Paracoccus sp. S-4012 TaxID=2665648 RepID=UPI0018A1D91A|nr:M14-type cytosolic carboxypeptidase [Paracoccus sp. S-4012]
MKIEADFPTGRVEVVDASDPGDIRLRVPADTGTDFLCWYNFRVTGPAGVLRRFTIENASDSLKLRLPNRENQAHQWLGAGPVASADGENWTRLAHHFDGRAFRFWHVPRHEVTHYAKFAPYPPEREAAFLDRCAAAPGVTREAIGQSTEGRRIEMLRLGSGPLNFWVIARQHPSETQGAFFLEGMLERLLTPDADARALLSAATLQVVPNVNPDGWMRGHTRANADGLNLNREWSADNPAPEVAAVRDAMERTGVDFCLDCHADNELEYVFAWASENVPAWTPARRQPFELFERNWAKANPDYIPGRAYPGGCPAEADLSMGWNWIGNRFPDSLSILLEQPFKDVQERPDPLTGWSPQRAHALGRAVVVPMAAEAARRSEP